MSAVRLGLVVGALSLLSACGNTAPQCLPSNCAGCCDASGECVELTNALSCGARGSACQQCLPSQSCLGGFCTNTGSSGGGAGATGGGSATGGGDGMTGGGTATGGGDGTTGGGSATGGGDGTTGGGTATGGGDGTTGGGTAMGGGVGTTGGGSATGGGDGTTGGGTATGGGVGTTGGGDGTTGGGSATGGGVGTTGGGTATGGGDGTTGGGTAIGGGVGTTGGGTATGGGVGATGGGSATGGGTATGGGVGTTGGGSATGGGVGTTGGGSATGGGAGTTGGGAGTTGGGTGSTGGGTGTTASAQIAALRAAAVSDMDFSVNIAVPGALVTAVKPLVPNASSTDPAGFFVQATQTGPAIFVQVNPATFGLWAGDRIDFTATAVARVNGLAAVKQLSALTRTSSGNSVAALSQNVNNVNFGDPAVSELYESELLTFSGTFNSEMIGTGSGYVGATITTGGSSAGALRVRIPTGVHEQTYLGAGCALSISNVPLWRYQQQAQASSWEASDLSNFVCPTPRLLSATPLAANTVRLTFNRQIDHSVVTPSSVSISGLTVSAVTVSGVNLTVTTSAQTPGASYNVTVTGLRDMLGIALALDGRSTNFNGFQSVSAPGLVINEVNYDSVGADTDEYIEIYNGTAVTQSMVDRSIVLINGGNANGLSYLTVDLSSAGSLAPGQYLLLASSDTIAANTSAAKKIVMPGTSEIIQNGAPDAVVLVVTSTQQKLDAISYEGDTWWNGVSVKEHSNSTSALADNNGTPGSISRLPNGVDTNNNAVDWNFTSTMTPGYANQ